MKKRIAAILTLLLVGAFAAGCGNTTAPDEVTIKTNDEVAKAQEPATDESASESSEHAGDGSVKTVKVAFKNSFPNTYIDQQTGEATGYEVEALKLVDESIPEYEFEYVNVDGSDAIFTGLSTGKYDIALGNLFYTVERGEEYIVPENQVGSSPMGIYRSTDHPELTSLDEVAKSNVKFQPFNHGNGLTRVIEEYNEAHPDEPIEFDYTDNYGGFSEYVQWVLEGRIDAGITQLFSWNADVEAEDGAYHQFADKLLYDVVITVPTYPLINKQDTELAEKVNDSLGVLKSEGKLVDLSYQFFGLNVFDY